MDMSLMGELVEIVRHARQGAEIGGILLRHRFTDVSVYGKFIDEGRQRALPVLAPSQQLRIAALVEIYLDGILPFLPFVRPWATALVLQLSALGCLGIIHIFDCRVWHGRLLSRGFSGRKTYTCSPNTPNFLLRRGNQDCCAAGKGKEGRQKRANTRKARLRSRTEPWLIQMAANRYLSAAAASVCEESNFWMAERAYRFFLPMREGTR